MESNRTNLWSLASLSVDDSTKLTLSMSLVGAQRRDAPRRDATLVWCCRSTNRHDTSVTGDMDTTHTHISGLSSWVVSVPDCSVRGPRLKLHCGRVGLSQQLVRYTALGTGCAPLLQYLCRLNLPPSMGQLNDNTIHHMNRVNPHNDYGHWW